MKTLPPDNSSTPTAPSAASDAPDHGRIARNALYLYGRMFLTIGVSLYTARVVLDTLGVNNYAIYNLVGGIVTVMSFLNGTMASATQRFLNYEMGAGSEERLRRTFSTSLLIHLAIAAIVLLLGETVGLWFVNTKLVIAPERMTAANITYQLSILAAMFSFVQIPYMASVLAHEKMDFYAVVAIVNVLLKLAVALAVVWFASLDTLVAYAVMMLMATVIVAGLYRFYAVKHFRECRFSTRIDKGIFRSLISFSGWDIYGNLSYTTRVQGTIVILNNFGGTVLNAAGNLTLTVAGTITSFAASVVSAFRPQIIQQYARQNYREMLTLLNTCARYSFLLMGLIVVPMILEMPQLLRLWLKDVPEFTTVFCRISLLAACGELLITIVSIGIHASGRIKSYSFITGTLYLLELPAMYFLLKATQSPTVVYVVHCLFILLILLTDTILLHRFVPQFSIARFWWGGVLVPALIVAAAFAGACWVTLCCSESFLRAVLTAMASTGILALTTFWFGFDGHMRATVRRKLGSLMRRKRG